MYLYAAEPLLLDFSRPAGAALGVTFPQQTTTADTRGT
jgi:hypothetical protein